MHVGAPSLTRQPGQSILPTGVPSQALSKNGFTLAACLSFSLSRWLRVHISGARKMISCSGWPVSLLANPGCLFAKGLQEVPMQYPLSASGQAHQLLQPRLQWVGEAIPISLPLSASLRHLTCTLSPSSSHLVCHLSAIPLSLYTVLYLSLAYLLFTSLCLVLLLQFFPPPFCHDKPQ